MPNNQDSSFAVEPSQGLSVLVVAHDAHKIGQQLTGDAKIGHICTATDALGALCAISAMPEPPHVLVLDADVPHLDAVAFLSALMEVCAIPVVFCACAVKHGPEIIQQALDAGAAIANHHSMTQTPENLMEAILQVVQGRPVVPLKRHGEAFFQTWRSCALSIAD